MPDTRWEQRREPRFSRSNAIWWRCRRDEPFRIGWLLECSTSGAAFIFRGEGVPGPRAWIEVFRQGAPTPDGHGECGAVVRTTPVHDDLVLIAAQFAPQSAAKATAAAEAVIRRARPGTTQGAVSGRESL